MTVGQEAYKSVHTIRERTATVWRLSQLASHLALGGMTSQLRGTIISKCGESRHLFESPYFQGWLDRFVCLLKMDISLTGEQYSEGGCLYVANHISWIDAVALAKVDHFSFVAKHEVRQWPVIGAISQQCKTVYINRHNKFSVYRSLPALSDHLKSGGRVLVFPEGTTSDGNQALPFYPMLFEAAVRASVPVQAISIRYTDPSNRPLPDVSFIDDDTVIDTLLRLLAHDRVIANIEFLPIEMMSRCRKQLAQRTREQIDRSLELTKPPRQPN